MPIKDSELILNPDGSIYHLNLRPEHIADTIITVGDPDRVLQVASYFDVIEFKTQRREFHTTTGVYRGKRLTVLSTGIGTDNIDIVFNELDALVNIDLSTREIKRTHTPLSFIRIGTSGAIQRDIPIDSFLISERAIGFDNLLHFYSSEQVQDLDFSEALKSQLGPDATQGLPYVVNADKSLLDHFHSTSTILGNTLTNVGFYGPQQRILRLAVNDSTLKSKLTDFNYKGHRITNLEMETSGIYGLSLLLGHHAISLNAIIANRETGVFSKAPQQTIANLIEYTLDKLTA